MKPRNSNSVGGNTPPPSGSAPTGRPYGQRIAHTHRPAAGAKDSGSKRPAGEQTNRIRPSSPTLLGHTDPGPRPESNRQRELRNHLTGRDIIDRTVPRIETPPIERNWREGRRRHVRDTETTHVRRFRDGNGAMAETRPNTRNRRRVDYWPFLLRTSLIALALECVAVALWSPRLRVKETLVEGNTTIPTSRLLADLAIPKGKTLTVLPVRKMQERVLKEPVVDSAEVHRSLPGTVRLIVHERKPWASVRFPDGSCYIIDRKLVPFKAVGSAPVNLPHLELVASSENARPEKPVLGQALKAAGLASVATCLRWASINRFPLDSVEIAADGQLCLNRRGDVPIKLGAVADLDRKLKALSILMDRRTDLRTATDIAYVNLLAPDAPAIMPRMPAAAAPTAASASTVKPETSAPPAASGALMTATEVRPQAAPEPVARPSANPDSEAPAEPSNGKPGSAGTGYHVDQGNDRRSNAEPIAPTSPANP